MLVRCGSKSVKQFWKVGIHILTCGLVRCLIQFQKSPVAAHMYGTHILRMDFLGMRNWCHQNGFIVGGGGLFSFKEKKTDANIY